MAKDEILIVDDNEDVRLGLQMLLEARGYTVELACNGEEALQKLRDGLRPSLVILDLAMPKIDGRRFKRKLLKEASLASLPVVLFSGEDDLPAIAESLDVREHMRKPVDAGRLYALLETYCRNTDASS